MEKKAGGTQGIEKKALQILKALLCAYAVTGILLLALTLLLYKMNLSEENVNAGIILIYVISTFASGFVIGKLAGTRKFLWGILTGALDQQVGEALCEITSIDPPMDGESEKYQPLEIQGAWQLGYYAGRGKHPLAAAEFDISTARRARKMTQAQLAEAMGVDQAVISRWESGKVSPNAENLAKLKEILG